MSKIADLPPELRDSLAGRDLIVFHGECVLCSGFFKTMLRLDKDARFAFATAQSPLGTALFDALGLSTTDYETNLVIVNGVVHQRLDAFAAAMSAVGWPWRVFAVVGYLPEPLRSFLYHRIAKNRYAIFGRYDTSMMPTPELSARFIHSVETAA